MANAGRKPSPAACADATKEDHDATEDQDMAQLVLNLCIPELREKALLFLSKVNDPWSSRTPAPPLPAEGAEASLTLPARVVT